MAKKSVRTSEELNKQFDEVKQKIASAPATDAASAKAAATYRTEVMSAAKSMTAPNIVNKLSSLGLELQGALDQVKTALVHNVQDLEKLLEAKAIVQREIEELHDKEVVAATIDTLISSHNMQMEAFEHERKNAEARYADEHEKHLQEVAERQRQLDSARQREQDEHTYRVTMERRIAEDKFKQECLLKERQFNEAMAQKQKEWKDREAALVAREAELIEYKKQVEGFPAKLKADIDTAVAAALAAANKEFSHMAALEKNTADGIMNRATDKILYLEHTIKQLQAENAALQAKVNSADMRVESIAREALASASGRQAMEATQKAMATMHEGTTKK